MNVESLARRSFRKRLIPSILSSTVSVNVEKEIFAVEIISRQLPRFRISVNQIGGKNKERFVERRFGDSVIFPNLVFTVRVQSCTHEGGTERNFMNLSSFQFNSLTSQKHEIFNFEEIETRSNPNRIEFRFDFLEKFWTLRKLNWKRYFYLSSQNEREEKKRDEKIIFDCLNLRINTSSIWFLIEETKLRKEVERSRFGKGF